MYNFAMENKSIANQCPHAVKTNINVFQKVEPHKCVTNRSLLVSSECFLDTLPSDESFLQKINR